MENICYRLYSFVFYEDIPACILLGYEIQTESLCEEISTSFDFLFYFLFATSLILMLIRLVKITVMFGRVLEYLLLVRLFKGCTMFNHYQERNKKFLLLIRRLHAYNESYFGVNWEKATNRLTVQHNLQNHAKCENIPIPQMVNIRNRDIITNFLTLFARFRPQTTQNADDIKLIFMNNKYCDGHRNGQTNIWPPSPVKVKLNRYMSKISLFNYSSHKIAIRRRRCHQNEREIYSMAERDTVEPNAQLLIADKQDLHICTATNSQTEFTLKEKMISLKDIYNRKLDIVNRPSNGNKQTRKLMRFLYIPKYPMLLLEKNYMRITVKKYYNTNNMNPFLNKLVCKRLYQLKTYGIGNKVLREDYISNNRKCRKHSNSTAVKKNNNNNCKSDEDPVKICWKVNRQSPTKIDESPLIEIEGNKYKNSWKQQKKLLNIAENDSNCGNKNHSVCDCKKMYLPANNVNVEHKNSITETKSFNLSGNNCIKYNLSQQSDKRANLNYCSVIEPCCNDTHSNAVQVRQEIADRIENLPNATLTTLRYRYTLHKNNKNKISHANCNLDVIKEYPSQGNLDTSEN